MYQIAKVESGDSKNPVVYRVQININFTYEECFSDDFVKEPSWGFIDERTFENVYDAVKEALTLYHQNIKAKQKEYIQAKNSIVIDILTWQSLKSEIGNAINALGGKIPRSPLM